MLCYFVAAPAQAGHILYGLTGPTTNKSLVTINPTTGATTVVGAVGAGFDLEGLDYNPANGFLYGSTGIFDAGGASLVRIDRATGAGVRVGNFNVPNAEIDGVAFHPTTGQLFGLAQDGNLYRINTTTGQATLVGPLGLGINEAGLAFDAAGNLFGIDTILDQLFAINPATGQGTPIGPVGFTDINGLDVDPDTGLLFGIGLQSQSLITINTGTGAGTFRATLNGPGATGGAVAIAFAPDTTATVPEPATAALLAAGAAALGVVRRRRRIIPAN